LSSSDDELIKRIQDRDPSAFQQVVDQNFQVIAAYLTRMLGSHHEAEDLAQEVFIRLWTKADQWQSGRGKLSTWLHRIAHNLCMDHFRKQQPNMGDEALEDTAGGEEPVDMVSHEEMRQALGGLITALPERQRSALIMCHYQGMSNREAADILEVSVDALESLLSRARRTLRQQLSEQEV